MTFSAELRAFVDEQRWTFAKTMPEWPHEYIVSDRVDEQLFERLVVHIWAHGVEGRFYEKRLIYYEEAGLVYWTMGAPLSQLGSGFHPSVSGFRQKLDRVVDIKQGGLVPIQNLARYHALAHGITIQATLDRLAAICKVDAEGAECDRTLREAYLTLKQLQLEHHAEAVRAGKKPDNVIDTDALRPLTRANLQEALRAVAAAQNH